MSLNVLKPTGLQEIPTQNFHIYSVYSIQSGSINVMGFFKAKCHNQYLTRILRVNNIYINYLNPSQGQLLTVMNPSVQAFTVRAVEITAGKITVVSATAVAMKCTTKTMKRFA